MRLGICFSRLVRKSDWQSEVTKREKKSSKSHSFLDLVRRRLNTTHGVRFFSMSLPKEPEPDPGGRAAKARPGNDAGRILKMAPREGEGYVREAMRQEFISG